MKILPIIYNLDEVNKFRDEVVVELSDYSFKYGSNLTVDEIKLLKSKYNKEVYLSINPIYKDNELDKLENILNKLNDLDYYIISDLGVAYILKNLGLEKRIIYAPETFITNELSTHFFNIDNYMISREIDLESIKKMLMNKNDKHYLIKGFGYQLLSYSLRRHISNFKDVSRMNIDENSFNLTIMEETRDNHFRIIEDNHGTRIYKDKIFNIYNYLDDIKNVDFIFLDRIFIDSEMYFDTYDLFMGIMNKDDYFNKYNNFEEAYLFNKVGLFKEVKND